MGHYPGYTGGGRTDPTGMPWDEDDEISENDTQSQTATNGHPLILALLVAACGFLAGVVVDVILLIFITAISAVFKIKPEPYWIRVLLLTVLALATLSPASLVLFRTSAIKKEV